MKKEKTNVLVIGSGPAGYTAAIYASRASLSPILYQGLQPGGQLTLTSDVENFPGYSNGIQGPEMMIDFQKQAQRFGTDIRSGMITEVDLSQYPYQAVSDDGSVIIAETIIISTGASAKWLGLASEKRLYGKGVSACAVCDGFFYKNQNVAVIGGGDSAAEEALYLANICQKVHLIVRKDKMKASKIMQKRVLDTKNIDIHWNSETDEIIGEDQVEAVRIINNKTGKKSKLNIEGFFVAIGHTPNTSLFKDYLNLDTNGYIITKPDSTLTNVEGVFACGDVQDSVYRQAVTAAGTGCMAALDAERFLGMKHA